MVHPVANFVVARAMERVNTEQLGEAYEEVEDALGKIISKGPLYLQSYFMLTCYSRIIKDGRFAGHG